tara:strand:- start:306 stop:1598 length:1293 start_codon:yes stop_codon:yes gene_type:complete
MFCKIINSNEIKKSIDKLFTDFSVLSEVGEKLSLFNNTTLKTKSTTQAAVYSRHKDEMRLIKSLILNSSIKAEMMSPGSSDLCLNFLMNTFNKNFDISDDVINTLNRQSLRPDKAYIKKYIKEYFDDNVISSLITDILDISDKNSKVIVGKRLQPNTIIHKTFNNVIPIKTNPAFLKQKTKFKDANVVLIDGSIMEISEINSFMELAHKTKEPYILFARTIGDDVLNTIHTNNLRESFTIIPIEVPMEENTLNMLKDLSVITGATIASSDMGDIISMSLINGIQAGVTIDINSTSVIISNSKNQKSANILIKNLTEKLKSPDINKDIINARLKGLTSNTINVDIGTELLNKCPLIIEDCDRFFRHLTQLFKFGIIEKNKIETADNSFTRIIKNVNDKKYISTASLLISLKFANQIKKDLKSTNYFIMEDR